MKYNLMGFSFNKIILSTFLVLSLTCVSNTKVSALENLADVEQQLLEIKLPDLPKVDNPDPYFLSPDEIYKVELILRLGTRKVEVYEKDKLIASFPVAVGKQGWETPTGDYEVIQMIKDPAWQNPWTGKVIPPSPDNPLGERWIGFWTDGKNFIGFHGTPGEHLIGQAVSHGCVRMKNKDIKVLFDLVSLGISVKVVK